MFCCGGELMRRRIAPSVQLPRFNWREVFGYRADKLHDSCSGFCFQRVERSITQVLNREPYELRRNKKLKRVECSQDYLKGWLQNDTFLLRIIMAAFGK
jgi:hypothetical protein